MKRVTGWVAAATLLAASLVFAGSVQAQVAAPSLNPTALILPEPFNPAVMMWHEGSRIGVAYASKAKVKQTISPNPSFDAAEGKGTGLSLEFVGKTFGFSAATSRIALDLIVDPVNQPIGGSTEVVFSQIGIGAMLGQTVSVGIGAESTKNTDSPAGSPSSVQKRNMPLVGGVLHLGQSFYIGGTYGKEKLDENSGGFSATGDHAVGRVGLGFYEFKGDRGYHAEAYHETDRLLSVTDSTGLTTYLEEGNRNGGTIEVLISGVLIGVAGSKASLDIYDASGFPVFDTLDITERTISIGWVKEPGLAVVVNAQHHEENRSGAMSLFAVDAVSLGVTFQF